jgi:RNA polymerase sigma-70 factor (ECF subfamily)
MPVETASPIRRSPAEPGRGLAVRSVGAERALTGPVRAKRCAPAEGKTAPALRSPHPGANGLSAFVRLRPRLFAIAYRILGSAAAAEDVVQEAWLRWQASDRGVVLNTPAYLATTTTRLAINLARSARVRREKYVGTWLPEPADTRPDPPSEVERREAVRHAVLVLQEALSPKERAAYLLREAFDYPYRQIACILQLAEANARQLVARARKRVVKRVWKRVPDRKRAAPSARQQRLFEAFTAAAQKGDFSALEELLASDIPNRGTATQGCSGLSQAGVLPGPDE